MSAWQELAAFTCAISSRYDIVNISRKNRTPRETNLKSEDSSGSWRVGSKQSIAQNSAKSNSKTRKKGK